MFGNRLSMLNLALLVAAVEFLDGLVDLDVLLVLAVGASVCGGGDPEAGLTVTLHALVLAGEIHTLGFVGAALGKGAGTGGELGRDGSAGFDPVGEGVLAVLDDAI